MEYELHPRTGLEMAGRHEGSAVCRAVWAFHPKRPGLGRTTQLLRLESVTGTRGKMVQSPLIDGAPEPRIPLADDTESYVSDIPLFQGPSKNTPLSPAFLISCTSFVYKTHSMCHSMPVSMGDGVWEVCSDIIKQSMDMY